MNLKMKLNPELIYHNAVIEGVRYIKSNPGIKVLVLGLSGGIDSAITAALARAVADKTGIRVVGGVLPIVTNDEGEVARACIIGKEFCHEYTLSDLSEAYLTNAKMCAIDTLDDIESKVRSGNIKARTRMIFLYDLARKYKGMVLSTDNYTELLLGFWTLHGDVGDFGFIQELWKTEVYVLSEWMALNVLSGPASKALLSCVEAKPTDGLGISDSDIDQILPEWRPSDGTYRDAYKLVDEILIGYLTGQAEYNATHPVIARHLATEFKRLNPVSIPRDIITWVYNAEAA